VVAPDGTVYKEFYGTGWQKGLPTGTEVWSAGVKQKWTTIGRTQDNTGLNYQLNPRVNETNIYDAAGNRRRSTTTYTTFALPSGASCSLPSDVYEYQSNATSVLRRSHTDYQYDTIFLNRHIIGLPAGKYLYDGNNVVQAKTLYGYDWPQWPEMLQATSAAAIQHDETNFGPGTAAGRGNLVMEQRWDASDPNNYSKVTELKTGYWTTGAAAFIRDPSGHQSNINYSDSFSDGNNSRNTFAYPTTFQDADLNSSYVQYNFDFGANTRKQGPPPAGQSQGVIQTITYDNAARIDRLTTTNTGAYTRYVYGPYYMQSWTSIISVADDSYAIQTFDGVGRVIGAASYHPGSAGGYKAQLTQYDNMGRIMKQSNPSEINAGWVPSGDDSAGWLYTQQSYDWNGRPLITTNTDLTTKSVSYGGCGCAGGEVVTLTDEGTLNGQRRQQKIYHDVLGREWKTEVLNWEGGSPYSATVSTFNVRDQVTQLRQYAGAEGSGTYQDTTTTYDGYGRLKTKHVPEQNTGTATTYDYFADDTIQKVTDGRGATATFNYNGRHLVGNVTYALAGSSTIYVSYGYDAAGNRIVMNDGLGHIDYAYDQLSRMLWENRFINGISNPLPSPDGAYKISYSYNLANQLQSLTDPFNSTINYGRNNTGKLTSVTGSVYAGVSSYVSNVQYRAWGALKSASYGNDSSSTTVYNARLQPSQFRLTENTHGWSYIREDYFYFADGRLRILTDLDDTPGTNPPWTQRYLSRHYEYDKAGRVSYGYGTDGPPFSQGYGYDEFNNLIYRNGSYYYQGGHQDTATFTNNRRNGWSYNANGQLLSNPASDTDDAHSLAYDAAGRLMTSIDYGGAGPNTTVTYNTGYDGDGVLIYESQVTAGGPTSSSAGYILRSTPLGGEVITRLNQSGNKSVTNVPAEGLLFARQTTQWPYVWPNGAYVGWTQRNPLGITENGKGVYDPLGNYIPFQQMNDPAPPPGSYNSSSMGGIAGSIANPNGSGMGCLMDGMPTSCYRVFRAINSGLAKGLQVGSTGNVHVDLLRLGIVIMEGPLHDDTHLWGIWVVMPGSQNGFEATRTEPNTPTTGSQATPCNVQIQGDRARATVAVALGEGTPFSMQNQLAKEQQGNAPADRPLTEQDFREEAYYMASVVANRFNTGNYASYQAVVNERGIFLGAANGWQRLTQLGNNGSEYCERARYILDALNYIFDQGHGTNNDFMFWRGVAQDDAPGGRRAFRQGDQRAANTDFMHMDPTSQAYDRLPYWTVNGWRIPRR
jgi:YD repeat-containing protein